MYSDMRRCTSALPNLILVGHPVQKILQVEVQNLVQLLWITKYYILMSVTNIIKTSRLPRFRKHIHLQQLRRPPTDGPKPRPRVMAASKNPVTSVVTLPSWTWALFLAATFKWLMCKEQLRRSSRWRTTEVVRRKVNPMEIPEVMITFPTMKISHLWSIGTIHSVWRMDAMMVTNKKWKLIMGFRRRVTSHKISILLAKNLLWKVLIWTKMLVCSRASRDVLEISQFRRLWMGQVQVKTGLVYQVVPGWQKVVFNLRAVQGCVCSIRTRPRGPIQGVHNSSTTNYLQTCLKNQTQRCA